MTRPWSRPNMVVSGLMKKSKTDSGVMVDHYKALVDTTELTDTVER